MKPLLIGEGPSETGEVYKDFPLSGRPARVLCELAGIPPDGNDPGYGKWTWALYDRFEVINLFYLHQPRWSAPEARDAALNLERTGEPLVFLGRRVAAAFGWEREFGVFGNLDPEQGPVAVVIPHPSGLNRKLNDEVVREMCGGALREALRMAAEVPA